MVEHRFPKPGVGGSSPSWPAKISRWQLRLPFLALGNGMSTENKANGSLFDVVKWLVAVALFVAAVIGSGNYLYPEVGTLYRVLAVVVLMLFAIGAALTTKQGQDFLVLLKEANKERRKVVWPTPVETRQTTMIVVIVVVLAGLILWGLDWVLSSVVKLVVG